MLLELQIRESSLRYLVMSLNASYPSVIVIHSHVINFGELFPMVLLTVFEAYPTQ